jgi:hypothetical protein
MGVTVVKKIVMRDLLLAADKGKLSRKLKIGRLTLRSMSLWMRIQRHLELNGEVFHMVFAQKSYCTRISYFSSVV